ncbi:MAG: bile acid:sodium symporter family protein [Luteolibacter sp.]
MTSISNRQQGSAIQVWSLRITAGFPVWILLGCVWAWLEPNHWTWFAPWIQPGLGLIMLGMGLTLRVADFMAVARQPGTVLLGVLAQFSIMPVAGWLVAKVFHLPAQLALGLMLVACCPGGTASNVICYLARANVALSVLMTLSSTLVAVGMTPILTQFFAGKVLPVDGWALFQSMLLVVLLPLTAGVAVNTGLDRIQQSGRTRAWIAAFGPVVSVVLIVLIVACIVASKKDWIAAAAIPLFSSVFALHALGFAAGYGLMALLGRDLAMRRTASIEVGMQNSGLAAALAARHFSEFALAPVPAAISAVYHCMIGSALAAWWRRSDTKCVTQSATQND